MYELKNCNYLHLQLLLLTDSVQHCHHTRGWSLYQDPERYSKRVLTVLVLGRFAGYYTMGVVCHCKGHWPAATVQAAQDWPVSAYSLYYVIYVVYSITCMNNNFYYIYHMPLYLSILQ
jgi:hypothetical protein